MSNTFESGPPGLPSGVWMVACGVWVFVPEDASHTDISYAIRMLQRVEIDRMGDTARYDALIDWRHSDSGGT